MSRQAPSSIPAFAEIDLRIWATVVAVPLVAVTEMVPEDVLTQSCIPASSCGAGAGAGAGDGASAPTGAAAGAAGVSVDLEAAAAGAGFGSFADAVAAYNAANGTNYTEASAREALGQ